MGHRDLKIDGVLVDNVLLNGVDLVVDEVLLEGVRVWYRESMIILYTKDGAIFHDDIVAGVTVPSEDNFISASGGQATWGAFHKTAVAGDPQVFSVTGVVPSDYLSELDSDDNGLVLTATQSQDFGSGGQIRVVRSFDYGATWSYVDVEDLGLTTNVRTISAVAKDGSGASVLGHGTPVAGAIDYNFMKRSADSITYTAGGFVDYNVGNIESLCMITHDFWIAGTASNTDIGNFSVLGVTTDGGSNFTTSSFIAANSKKVFGIDASTDGEYIWACGSNGVVRKSSDFGASWSLVNVGATESLRSIWVSTDGREIIIGSQTGYVYRSSDFGATWLAVQINTTGDLRLLSAGGSSNNRQVLFGTGDGRIFYFQR